MDSAVASRRAGIDDARKLTSTRPTKRSAMARALLPSFMAGAGGLAFEGDDVEEECEAHQREEEHDVLRIDDAFRERIEVRDETKIRQRVRDRKRQHVFERVGETAEAEEEQDGARAEA